MGKSKSPYGISMNHTMEMRNACQAFIDHPTFETMRDISRVCKDVHPTHYQVPCVIGIHTNGDAFADCGDCPLANFIDRAYPQAEYLCPVCGGQSIRGQRAVYKIFKGELVIAMVRFVLGWEELDGQRDDQKANSQSR